MSKGRALALSAGIVTIATFAGRIFGFAREMVIANKFGASAETDAFLVAFTIPNIIYSLVVMGALSASFIPVFSGLLANDRDKEAWRLAHTVFSLLLIVFGCIASLLALFAPQVVFLVAPGMASGGQPELASNLLRLMAPALVFMGISGLITGVLNSYNHFALPSLVALVQNILVVASILLFSGRIGIYGAAVGLLIGSIGQVLIQLPALIKRKLYFKLLLDIRNDKLKNIGVLFIPVLISLAASQSNVIIDKWIASFLSTGSISYLNYAFKVGSLPVSTLIAAIAIVLFPTLSKHAAKNDMEALRSTISMGVRMIVMVAAPAAVGLFALSVPITSLLFEHGAFDRAATVATASALGAYSFGIIAMGLNMLLVRSFYALQDGMTPLKASLLFIVVLIGLDIMLVRLLLHVGLAAGYALAMTLMVLVLLRALQKRLGGLDERQIATSLGKITIASVVMGVAAKQASLQIGLFIPAASKMNELISVGLSISAGLLAYLLILVGLRTQEISLLWHAIVSRISRKRLAVDSR